MGELISNNKLKLLMFLTRREYDQWQRNKSKPLPAKKAAQPKKAATKTIDPSLGPTLPELFLPSGLPVAPTNNPIPSVFRYADPLTSKCKLSQAMRRVFFSKSVAMRLKAKCPSLENEARIRKGRTKARGAPKPIDRPIEPPNDLYRPFELADD